MTERVNILGIESSCDETSAAVVVNGREVLSNVVSSQVPLHRQYGGVVPELASREHLRQIVPVVREALAQASLELKDVDAFAVTRGPGLIGALLVGVTYAKGLALSLGKPLIGVNHLEGHVHAVLLEAGMRGQRPEFPAVCLIVSGGHTLLYGIELAGKGAETPATAGLGNRERAQIERAAEIRGGESRIAEGGAVDSPWRLIYTRLGGTRDDAAGEAYDKVARMLALGYPGGPIVDQLAAFGDASAIRFGDPKMKGNTLDFSFSGLKTAVLYFLRGHPEFSEEIEIRRKALADGKRTAMELRALCGQRTLDLAASFQRAAVTNLLTRTMAAMEMTGARSVMVSGGVAANSELRKRFAAEFMSRGTPVYFPSRELSTDNAAMIAAAAWPRLVAGKFADADLAAEAVLPLA
jgi:N6-L-threonylcarbamoyladenine synthase